MPTPTVTRLTPAKDGPLSARVFDTLRTAIFSGRFKPGEALRELHLARDLHVSQATVREALARLERLGLVVRTPNIRTEVTSLTPRDVRERIELRVLLETRAFVNAAPRMTPETFSELGARLHALADAIARNDYFEEAQADLAFHRRVWLQADNPTLYRTLDQLAVPLFAFVSILRGAHRQTLRDVVQSHEGLVDALRDGDPGRVTRALRDHFDGAFALPASANGGVPASQDRQA